MLCLNGQAEGKRSLFGALFYLAPSNRDTVEGVISPVGDVPRLPGKIVP